jgi:dipeptidyl aminopeptidase/acylaminoacyl peptidase
MGASWAWRAFVVVLVGCGGGGGKAHVAPVATSPKRPPPPEPPKPFLDSFPTPDAPPASVEPTVLGDADRAREAAFADLARASVDAYPNWNGLFTILVATWSPDGKRILFGSQRDGLPEIYVGDPRRPAARPLTITATGERSIWGAFTHDGRWILYNRDKGGDENQSYWKVGLDGKDAIELTPGERMRRFEPRLPRKKPRLLFYTGKRGGELTTRIFQLDLDGGEPREIFTQEAGGGLVDVTADAARLLVTESHSPDDIVLHEVDVASGKAHRVYPADGQRAGGSAGAYSADGKRIFLSTDDADGSLVLALDPATGKERVRYRDAISTGIVRLSVSPRGDRLAILVDAGNHGEVRVLDARTLKLVRNVPVPLGDVRLGPWRPDGRAFSLMIAPADRPPDVFAVDPATGKVSPLRDDARPELASLPAIHASIENVAAHDGLRLPLNVYRAADGRTDRRPVILIFHGGPAFNYAVRWSFLTRFYTALGYVVVEPNVRGSSGFGRPFMNADDRDKRVDWLRDLETVNAWVRAQTWCDPDRVVVMGGSYGGYTTLMALTRQPTLWRAGVDLFGVADLRNYMTSAPPAMRTALVPEFGDPAVEADLTLLDDLSPMRDVDKIVRPLFVYAGQNDARVPRDQSDRIVRALRTRNIPVEYMVAPNEGHAVDRRETKLELLTRTARFLEDALK